MSRVLSLLVIVAAILPLRLFAQQITVLTEHLPPFQFVEHNSISGLATDVIQAVFRKSEVDYQIEAHAWSDAYQQTLKQPNICLYSTARLPSRDDKFYWVGKIATATSSFYALTRRDLKLNSLEQAKQYRIAAIKDDASHHFLLANGFSDGENIYTHHNYDTLLHLLDIPSRSIDLVILSKEVFPYRLTDEQKPEDYQELMEIEALALHFYLTCNKKTDALVLSKLKEAMARLEKDGTLERIRQKWAYPIKALKN